MCNPPNEKKMHNHELSNMSERNPYEDIQQRFLRCDGKSIICNHNQLEFVNESILQIPITAPGDQYQWTQL